MAEDDDDSFSFGDFKFAPPQPQPTSTSKNDDVWPDLFFNPSPPQSQFNPSNSAQPDANPSPIWADPNPNNGWSDPFSTHHQNGDSGFCLNVNGVTSDLIVDHKDNNFNEDDEWEFKGAFSGNSVAEQGNFKEQGDSVVFGSKIAASTIMEQQKQAGQDASDSVNHKPVVISFVPQSIDFFASSYGNGSNHLSPEMDVGIKATAKSASTTNGFLWDSFPAVEVIGNGSGMCADVVTQDDDFDDFGDFVDASQEVVSTDQQEQVGAYMNPVEVQLPNGEVQENQTQTGHSRGALPLSLFSDDTEESNDCLNLQNEVVHMPTPSPGNSFSGLGLEISINDLISNLYNQPQLKSLVDSTVKPVENGVHSPPKLTVLNTVGEDDAWDDDSWEFKDACSENGVEEQLSTAIPVNMAQKQSENLPELQIYTDFYDQLREALCFLLSCQLDELKKARSTDVYGNGGKAETFDDEIQEASILLEENVISKEVLCKKDFERTGCLNNLLEVLQGPKFKVFEAEFSLSKRLQLAANEWRVATELLRHAVSMLKILSIGTADEQSLFASTWSKIINVCVQELRHGASIWKRASEKNAQHQILSDSRGQQFIQALGEIYKVTKQLGLSAKVYKPWILLNVSNSSLFSSTFFECDALWVNSGLEDALKKLSDDVDFRCTETAKALIASIKNIHDINVDAKHVDVFLEHKSFCQLSLLPQEKLADIKTVMWGGKVCFLNLANLWANLISPDLPQLPNLQVS